MILLVQVLRLLPHIVALIQQLRRLLIFRLV